MLAEVPSSIRNRVPIFGGEVFLFEMFKLYLLGTECQQPCSAIWALKQNFWEKQLEPQPRNFGKANGIRLCL